MKFSPETFPIIMAHEPAVSNAIDDGSEAICLKNADGAWIIVVEYTGGGDTDLALTVHEGATAAAAVAGTTPIAVEFPIWVNEDPATSDAMVRQADAVEYTIDATPATNVMVAMYIPAAILTAGRPWISLGTTGGNGANYACAIYILDGARYKQTTPPTAV